MGTRRDFVKGSALAVTASLLPAEAALLTSATAAEAPHATTGADGWYDRPMRWAQLAFVEDDPGNYDKQFWLDYFRSVHADAACLSAGGVVAFYPTQIPLQQRSAWLGDRDAFGEMLAGCRAMNMNVIARTDAHACWQKVYDAHPDWIRVDAGGQPVRHPSDPRYWETCALGPYNFEFMTSVHEEIMRMYRPDGIFTNRWAGSGMCYCQHCRENFRAASGLDLPRTSNPQDPARKQYIVWRQNRLFDLWRFWNEKIRAINPGASYHRQRRRRSAQRSRYEDHQRARSHHGCRSPGPPRPHGSVGQRQKRQGISRNHGQQSHRRNVQRGHRRRASLERFRAER